jgi:uncharacterized membrane protein
MLHEKNTQRVSSTTRIEAFSDGVFGIVMTLLIIEVHPPELHGGTLSAFLTAMESVWPQLLSFVFSFVAVAIFWVNHHHFYHQLKSADWPLLWNNLFLLLWLTIVPFTTAFLGEYPREASVVSLYAVNMMLGALAFNMMTRHAFFHSDLLKVDVPLAKRRSAARRGLFGIFAYGASSLIAWVSTPVAWLGLLLVPLYYFVPRLITGEEDALFVDQ